jgi:hypothetical protein
MRESVLAPEERIRQWCRDWPDGRQVCRLRRVAAGKDKNLGTFSSPKPPDFPSLLWRGRILRLDLRGDCRQILNDPDHSQVLGAIKKVLACNQLYGYGAEHEAPFNPAQHVNVNTQVNVVPAVRVAHFELKPL